LDYKNFPKKDSRRGAEMQRRRENKRIYILCVITLGIIFYLLSCSSAESSRTEIALGTLCTITVYDHADDAIFQKVFNRIHEIENLMSFNIPTSDVSRINAAAGIESVKVNDDVFTVIERALYFARFSDGAFDPTIGPLASLWDIGGDNSRVPSQNEINQALPLVNWRNVVLDSDSRTVFLALPGMALDLGAIAKGYAADEAAAIIKNEGIKRAVINLGGDIVVLGLKRDNSPWRVGVQKPFDEQGVSIGVLNILSAADSEQSVVTSGIYERFIERDGNIYHHIFSPSLGYPVDNGISSVTVIARGCMEADALSTAVFVLGYEEGRRLLEYYPGSRAIFINSQGTVLKNKDVSFVLRDNDFKLENFD
jgi:thiamine biosynthesis lipoprotein